MNKVNQIDENVSYLSYDNRVSLLLYGVSIFDDNKNNFILSASITYILETVKFSTSLFQSDAGIFVLALSTSSFHLQRHFSFSYFV